MHRRRETLAIAILLAIAALLRLHRLGDELWYDEIVTQIRVAGLDLRGIATTYESQNQHLLYSLLARVAIVALGDTPAVLRLPAALFGVLSVWALWLLGRDLLTRREALLAAGLLAVSDLHVWFSQNARGYTALLFATLLSSRLLLRALARERRQDWLAYAVVAALGLWVHLTMLFVLAGHAILVARRLPSGGRAAWRARVVGPVLGFGGAVALALLLYAPVVPSLLAVNATEGRDGVVAAWSSSRWVLGEVLRGLSDAFVHPWLALYAVALGCAGALHLRRSQPVLLELLVWPVTVGIAIVVGSGHHAWPRLFFFAIGFAALIVAHGADVAGRRLARWTPAGRMPATAVAAVPSLLLLVAAAAALPDAYGPKQRHAEAIAVVERSLRPGDVAVAAGPASRVLHDYYRRDWARIETAAELASVRAGAGRTFVVHTFPIQLRGRRGDVARLLEDEFTLVARLPGTLHGGEVLVWTSERRADQVGFAEHAE